MDKEEKAVFTFSAANLVIIGVVILAAATLLGVAVLLRPQVAEDVVIISVDGKAYERVALSDPRDVTINQDNGAVNIIHVTEKGAVMQYSTCDNQLCVHMGEVTVDNWQYRANQQFIVCLPNRVSVELAVAEEAEP